MLFVICYFQNAAAAAESLRRRKTKKNKKSERIIKMLTGDAAIVIIYNRCLTRTKIRKVSENAKVSLSVSSLNRRFPQ